ncbi:disulfide bond formation protein B [Facilibium subflavum]|uniref:disulfide bond formation protein B n=1 Tax=Facilibium subflavum TaxID=2219058 RepID=UPI000E64859C|nr:disulfide bond formation protein B [Facilibium subflavum]
MRTFKIATLYQISFIACCILILAIIYFVASGLKPCPMCLLQQLGLICLTVISFIAMIHKPKSTGVRVYSFLLGLIALVTALIAAKQIWMQYHPEQYIGSCQAGVDTLFHNLPFLGFVKSLLHSAPGCETVDWRFLGLSMAGYSFIFFIVFSAIHFWQFLFFLPASQFSHLKNQERKDHKDGRLY